ncbi:MAG: hypothetical protein MUE95_06600, partial [Cyclobacteriaceae bacterium]|nr:hypothetical protein [Cyclobacteriaceae bacterium]
NGVIKARVQGAGIDQIGRAQLLDAAQALHGGQIYKKSLVLVSEAPFVSYTLFHVISEGCSFFR